MAGYGTFNVEVDMNINGVWTDISPYVMKDQNVVITRGHPDWSTTTNPGQLQLVLNNSDGRFTPKNPTGPYYPYLGRNTQVRVSINSGALFRFYGEAASFDQVPADASTNVVFCNMTAAGVLQRLGNSNPLNSVMKRYWLKTNSGPVVQYWPCEAVKGDFDSALADAPSMQIVTAAKPKYQADTNFACSSALPTFNNSSWSGGVPNYSGNTDVQVMCLLDIPSTPDTDGCIPLAFRTSGTISLVTIRYDQASSGTLTLQCWGASGALLSVSPTAFTNVNGLSLAIRARLSSPSGGNITVNFDICQPGGAVSSGTDTIAATTLGQVQVVTPNLANFGLGTANNIACGHIVVLNASFALSNWAGQNTVLYAYAGETAGNRISRLCTEEGITFSSKGTLANSAAMGPQSQLRITDLFQQCVDADRGMLYETRDALGLGYRTRYNMQNRAADLTLDYSLNQLIAPLEPIEDDQNTLNDVTVTLTSGGTAHRHVVTSGPLSNQAPPNGVGTYATSLSLNPQSESQARDLAGWIAHTGTVNEPRYPQLSVELGASHVSGILATIEAIDLGDYIQVINPQANATGGHWIPFDPIKQIVNGLTEIIGNKSYFISYTGVPEVPLECFLVQDAVYGHIDSDGSTLFTTAASNITQLIVTTTPNKNFPLWTTSSADLPFDVLISGERCTVTDIEGPPDNFFTGDNSAFDTTLGNWTARTNCAVGQVNSAHHSGTGALQLSSSAAGDMIAASCTAGNILTQGLACVANDVISCSAWFETLASARVCSVGAEFYTSGGVVISNLYAANTITDATSSWTKLQGTVTAPATSAFCRLTVKVAATGGASEIHYVDDAYIADVNNGSGIHQTMRVTRAVNGVSKSLPSGSTVSLFFPPIISI